MRSSRVDAPGRPATPGTASATTRHRPPPALLAAALVAFVLIASLPVGCGNADPFTGLYREPAGGRRVEIQRDGDGYKVYFGRDVHPYAGVRTGDELTITDPMGGKSVVRLGPREGTLELVSGGESTLLEPLPQHQ